jgi:hypothetical protein
MATVNLTPALTDSILDAVATPFAEKYVETATLSKEESIYMFDTYFITPDQHDKMKALPKNWVNLSLHSPLESSLYIINKSKESKHWLKLQLPKQNYFIEHGWSNSPSDSSPRTIEAQRYGWREGSLTQQALPFETPYLDNLTKICEERDALVSTVTKILDKCATLNQVEKVWPAVRKYVKQEIIERLERKNTPRTAASVGIDESELQELNVATIRMQMTA